MAIRPGVKPAPRKRLTEVFIANPSRGVTVGDTVVDASNPLPVMTPDGSDATLGAKADVAATTDTDSFSLIALFKRLLTKFLAQGSTTSGQTGVLILGAVSGGPTYVNGQSSPLSLSTNGYLRVAISSGSVSQSGTWTFGRNVASAAALTNVANSATSVTVLASNANRKGALFFNDDTAVTGASLYLKFGATASTTSFTKKLAPQEYYELPEPVYTGIIDGIASAATGSCRVTEIT